MNGFRYRFAFPALIALVAAGCLHRPPPAPPTPPPGSKEAYWIGDGVPGEPRIVIDLSDQRAYFYKGSKLVGESRASTGRSGFDTPPGTYRINQKDKDHVSNLYGDFVDEAGEVVKKDVDLSKEQPPEGAVFRGAQMPYFLRFHAGYGMHAGRVPNYRASHGCVRLPRVTAQHFFENAPYGTAVVIQD